MSGLFAAIDPFPLVSVESYDYARAKMHAAAADHWLGFDIERIESQILQKSPVLPGTGRWHGLPAQSLLTPYIEIRLILELCQPKPGQIVADLGCAYGRMGLVIDRHFPRVHFAGYEIEALRVAEAQRILQRLNNPDLKVTHCDLADPSYSLEAADFYFIYDYGTVQNIQRTLSQLQGRARSRPLVVIGRGRGTRHVIQTLHPWLCEVNPPTHTETFSIYRS